MPPLTRHRSSAAAVRARARAARGAQPRLTARPAAIAPPSEDAPDTAPAAPATPTPPDVPDTIDYAISGLRTLSASGRARALDPKANPFEKKKNAKGGDAMWTEVHELVALLKSGQATWEDLDLDDVDVRLKWVGMFHRRKRTPGKFMMRVRVPNGELTAAQLRALHDCIALYGADGCADITTRAGVQLRGIPLDDADRVFDLLASVGLTALQSGMDNVRQVTGSPIAGLDPFEVADTRPLAKAVDALITNSGSGNLELSNLPRKLNISFSASRDDFVHSHINDLAFEAAVDPGTGDIGWNVMVGGYLSMKRCAVSVPLDTFVPSSSIVDFCRAFLLWFRDNGARGDRQKARVMWLLEEVGVEAARDAIAALMASPPAGGSLARAVHHAPDPSTPASWPRRDILGVHPQRQAGLNWVGACIPVGRLHAPDFPALATAAETYGDGTVRFTVDENVVLPNVPDASVDALLADPLFADDKFPVPRAGGKISLATALVSCTGAQFCGLALAETKLPALDMVRRLDRELALSQPVRIHVTGCPNSCGQAQVGDIGLIGAPAKKQGPDGKKVAVPGFNVILGGTVGEAAQLAATEFEKSVPEDEVYGRLKALLMERFGAVERVA